MSQSPLPLARYRIFALFGSMVTSATGFLILAGWLADIPPMAALGEGRPRINFSAGLCLVLLGMSLMLLARKQRKRILDVVSQALAAAACVIACLALLHYGLGWDIGIDRFFISGRAPADEAYHGQMSAIGATIILLLGIALLLTARDVKSAWVDLPVLVAAVNIAVPLIGYLYGKAALYDIPFYGTVPFPAAMVLLLLCASIFAARPERGLMGLLTNRSAGGITARMLLPAALLLPVVIVRVEFLGYEADWYDITADMIIITLSSMFIFTVLILWNARLLLKLDAQRNEAEDTLQQALDVLESNLHALSASNARLASEVGERRAVEETLFHEHERAQVTLNAIVDGVVTTDINGKIAYMNPAAEKMTGWSSAQATGQPLHAVFQVIEPVSRQPVNYPLDAVLHRNATTALPPQGILLHRSGTESAVNNSCSPIHDPEGKVIGAVLVFHDVSAVHAMAVRMSYVTQHDALTDLPNRFLFNDRLSQAIGLALRHHVRAAVLFLDLDRFKHVNDTLGHVVGDKLLKEIAVRLKRDLRETDTISRHGGDEFIIL
ncbi:diguanylate cyclase domain-containing protein, partial [Noviherbaspirillum denitrificans]